MNGIEALKAARAVRNTLLQPQPALAALRHRLTWYLFHRRSLREIPIEAAFDTRFGTDTGGVLSLAEIGISAHEAEHGNSVYRAVWPAIFTEALSLAAIDHRRFTFLDYGSGKGKAMLLASDYPFRRIIGIEYAAKLHEVALRNCQIYRSPAQRCCDLTPLLQDATAYVPPHENLLCFFFNPFDSGIMGQVLDRLALSARSHPREIYILYANARNIDEMGDFFAQLDFFVPVAKSRHALLLRAPSAAMAAP